jgi:hypothetical protein
VQNVSLERVRDVVRRLFIDAPGKALREEDEKKCRELVGVLSLLSSIKKGAHLVDVAAGKASVGLVACELLPIGQLTVIERDPRRIAACRSAVTRLKRTVVVDLREADLEAADAWPTSPDAVVALHACGGAADLAIEGAIRCGARRAFIVPCCYGESIRFRESAAAVVAAMTFVADDLVRRRMTASLIDTERALRLEAAGFQTDIEEFVAPTVTPHNLVLCARRTADPRRMARAQERLAALHEAGKVRA